MSSETNPTPSDPTRWIDLEPYTPLARGRSRLIFDHPQQPNRLLKVISPEKRARAHKKFVLRPSRRRFKALRGTFAELEEYLALLARNEKLPEFLPRFFGFVDTSFGPGQIVEKICLDGNDLAPALSSWRDTDLQEKDVAELLDNLLQEIERAGMMASDLSANNIVIARQPVLRLVVVDGFGGDKHWRVLTALAPGLLPVYRKRVRKRLLTDVLGNECQTLKAF